MGYDKNQDVCWGLGVFQASCVHHTAPGKHLKFYSSVLVARIDYINTQAMECFLAQCFMFLAHTIDENGIGRIFLHAYMLDGFV